MASESTVGSTREVGESFGAMDGGGDASPKPSFDADGIADGTDSVDAIRALVSLAQREGIAVLRDDRGDARIVLTIPTEDIPSPLIDPPRDPPRDPDPPGAHATGGDALPSPQPADRAGARGPGALGGSRSMASATSETRNRARLRSRARRAQNLARGACINENVAGTHGKATHGIRCARCAAVHRRGSRVVRAGDVSINDAQIDEE